MVKRLVILFSILILSGSTVSAALFEKPQEQKPDITSQQAKALYAQNDIDETQKLLLSKSEEDRSAEDWLILGNIYQDKSKIDEAVYMFNKALEKNPKYYKAYYNLGYIYLVQDKPNLALTYLKKAVRYNPNFSYGYYNIGCAYLKLKSYGLAKYNFFKAIDLQNNDPNIYYNLAYAYKMMNKEKQAKTYLDIYNKIIESGK